MYSNSKIKNKEEENRINRKEILPPKVKKVEKTLFLDLDETLIHSTNRKVLNYDFWFIRRKENKLLKIYVLVRPFLKLFLEEMNKIYEIVIYTASVQSYASTIINILDNKRVVSFRLFREHCTSINGIYTKNLNNVNRNIKDVIIIDNLNSSFLLTPMNGIKITSWFGDSNDNELLKLIPLLKYLSKVEDVRDFLGNDRKLNIKEKKRKNKSCKKQIGKLKKSKGRNKDKKNLFRRSQDSTNSNFTFKNYENNPTDNNNNLIYKRRRVFSQDSKKSLHKRNISMLNKEEKVKDSEKYGHHIQKHKERFNSVIFRKDKNGILIKNKKNLISNYPINNSLIIKKIKG